ncbi:MAG: glycine cleavage system protein H [Chloroflexota bacterium]
MAIYYGCDIPEELYYHPEYDVWVRFEEDDTATLGMVDVAQTAAGKLLYLQFKPVGKKIKTGGSAATIESSKWVGPFRMPFDVEILANNLETFTEDVLSANKDPYGRGWLVKVRVLQPDTARDHLLTRVEAVRHYQKRIDEHNIRCFRCVDDAAPMQSE